MHPATFSRLPSSSHPSLSTPSRRVCLAGPLSPKSAGSPREYELDTSAIRESVINSRPRWPREHPLCQHVEQPPFHLGVLSRSRTEIRAATKAERSAGRGGLVSGKYTRVVAAKISFRFPSCPANVLRSLAYTRARLD